MSNFTFLQEELPILANLAMSAEQYLYQDPPVCLYKLRIFGEKFTNWLFDEHGLDFPYENTFNIRIKLLAEAGKITYPLPDLLHRIRSLGNNSSHEHQGTVDEATSALLAAFKLSKWLSDTYFETELSELKFSPPPKINNNVGLEELEAEYKQLEEAFNSLKEEKIQLSKERQETIHLKAYQNAAKIQITEAETRAIIDEQLRKAGWETDSELLKHSKGIRPEKGRKMAIAEWPVGLNQKADYALFIDTQLFGFIEAKKMSADIPAALIQSREYSKKTNKSADFELTGNWGEYKVPFLFATNGRPYSKALIQKSGIWFLDVRNTKNHPKALQGWYSPENLIDLFSKDEEAADLLLQKSSIDFLSDPNGLRLRFYQIEAIEAIEKTIKESTVKRALLAMATGTGKTRTIVGLCYRLIKSQRFKRILFLVDRSTLGEQAIDSFDDYKIENFQTFSNIYNLKKLKDKYPDLETRLHFATVQGMVKRLFYTSDNDKLPAVGTYDCIIVDEAHRGYNMDRDLDEDEAEFKNELDYQSKYSKVLDYFDAFRIGLTATPALHTVEIFGKPVYRYSYEQAVIDGFLTDQEPPYNIRTKLSEEGIVWEKGAKPMVFDNLTAQLIELDELEDELRIEVEQFNRAVITESFNRTVIAELVKHLDPESPKKTLVFAATNEHADLIVSIFKEEYQKIGLDVDNAAIEKITGSIYKPEEMIRRFKNEQHPNIVVTVDLLTTGIDVPAICNLVFMRRVRSRILYEQMLGRATRLCPEIGKETYKIFDAVRLYEALKDVSEMKPVVQNPLVSFEELIAELPEIPKETSVQKQIDQIVAKLQRKKRLLKEDDLLHFEYLTGGLSPDEFIADLRSKSTREAGEEILTKKHIFHFLDTIKSTPKLQLFSEHEDEYLSTERGYGKGQKPEDYLESFKKFIEENLNKIKAIEIVCNRPKSLTREALKELLYVLRENHFSAEHLKTAWKDAKNEDIAADIIAYIHTLALGSPLETHEQRVARAMKKVRALRSNWNTHQLKWLDRIEKQLLKSTVLHKADFDVEPFLQEGGYNRFAKLFDNAEEILQTVEDNLFLEVG